MQTSLGGSPSVKGSWRVWREHKCEASEQLIPWIIQTHAFVRARVCAHICVVIQRPLAATMPRNLTFS